MAEQVKKLSEPSNLDVRSRSADRARNTKTRGMAALWETKWESEESKSTNQSQERATQIKNLVEPSMAKGLTAKWESIVVEEEPTMITFGSPKKHQSGPLSPARRQTVSGSNANVVQEAPKKTIKLNKNAQNKIQQEQAEKIAQQSATIDSLRQQITILHQQSQQQSQQQNHQQSQQQSQQQNQQQNQQKNQQQNQQASQSDELASLKSLVSQQQETIAKLGAELEAKGREIAQVEERIRKENQAAIDTAKGELERSQSAAKGITDALNKSLEQINQLNTTIAKKDAEIVSKDQQIAAIQNQIQTAILTNENTSNLVKVSQEEKLALEKTVEDLNSKLALTAAEVQLLREQVNSSKIGHQHQIQMYRQILENFL